jgi:hypothetical protein
MLKFIPVAIFAFFRRANAARSFGFIAIQSA